MNNENINTTPSVPTTSSAVPAQEIPKENTPLYRKDICLGIIRKRKKSALTGLVVTNAVIMFVAFKKASSTDNLVPILIVFVVMNILVGTVFVMNSLSYSEIKPSYRIFNKVFYIYLSIFAVIFGILNFLGNIFSMSNPLHGFKDPAALSKTEIAVDTLATAGVVAGATAQISPGKYIDNYFKEQSTSPNV